MSLSNNLQLGTDALIYARSLIKSSSTAISTPADEALKLHEVILKMRNTPLDSESSLKMLFRVPNPFTSFILARIKRDVKRVKQFSIGNCGEFAHLALNYLIKIEVDHAELFYIEKGDHSFVVIGRAVGSDETNPATWGEDAVVCDPWVEKVYPASEILQKISCYEDLGEGKNGICSFNPSVHTFECEAFIGGNDRDTKQFFLRDAKEKLIQIQRSIKSQIPSPDETVCELLLQLEAELDLLSSTQEEERLFGCSNAIYCQKLSKMVRQYLNNALNVVGTENRSALTELLVKDWCVTLNSNLAKGTYNHSFFGPPNQVDNLLRYFFKIHQVYFDILVCSSGVVFLSLLDNIPPRTLQETVRFMQAPGKGNLLHILLTRQEENLFVRLIDKLDADSISALDRSSPFRHNQTLMTMLHAAAYLKLPQCFNALLNKYNPRALPPLSSMKVNDKSLPEIVLENLGPEAHSDLLNRIEVMNPENASRSTCTKTKQL